MKNSPSELPDICHNICVEEHTANREVNWGQSCYMNEQKTIAMLWDMISKPVPRSQLHERCSIAWRQKEYSPFRCQVTSLGKMRMWKSRKDVGLFVGKTWAELKRPLDWMHLRYRIKPLFEISDTLSCNLCFVKYLSWICMRPVKSVRWSWIGANNYLSTEIRDREIPPMIHHFW